MQLVKTSQDIVQLWRKKWNNLYYIFTHLNKNCFLFVAFGIHIKELSLFSYKVFIGIGTVRTFDLDCPISVIFLGISSEVLMLKTNLLIVCRIMLYSVQQQEC